MLMEFTETLTISMPINLIIINPSMLARMLCEEDKSLQIFDEKERKKDKKKKNNPSPKKTNLN